ncbi:hypothetical protein SESBI_35823 [Sesbania bispinosa]|nr:hypothetical protein SESBI_35823 [Sesbania bispinosa]
MAVATPYFNDGVVHANVAPSAANEGSVLATVNQQTNVANQGSVPANPTPVVATQRPKLILKGK